MIQKHFRYPDNTGRRVLEGGLRLKDTVKTGRTDHPLVSVITTVRNSVRYIEQAMKSVLDQTWQNIEYLIIDAASTDGTLDLIRIYQHRIDYVISEPDDGIYAGMNKGLSLASGDYIIFLNADDYYKKDTIEKLFAHALSNQTDMVAAHSYNIDENGNRVVGGLCCSSWTDLAYLVCPLKHETMLVHKRVYDTIGYYDETLQICADWYWMVQAYKKKVSVAILDEKLLFFRTSGKSADKKLEKRHAQERLTCYTGIFKEINPPDIDKLKYVGELSESVQYLMQKYPECRPLCKALSKLDMWQYAIGKNHSANGLRSKKIHKTSLARYPLVSVVTTVFNGARHIERAICSVLRQSYPNIEYVITDAGSTDGTLDIIHKYREHIDHYISEPDDGIYAGMNKGITSARGNYIIVLNADDYFRYDAVEQLVRHALNTDCKLVAAHAVFLTDSNEFLRISKSTVDDRLYLSCTIRHEALLVHRSVYEHTGLYDESLKICSDWMWMLKVYEQQYRIGIVDLPLLYFYASGVSGQTSQQHDVEKTAYFSTIIPHFDKTDIDKIRYPHHLQMDEIVFYTQKYPDSAKFIKSMNIFAGIRQNRLNGDISHKIIRTNYLESNPVHPEIKNRLKILLVNWGLCGKKGGLERVGAELANNLAKKGHHVSIFSPLLGEKSCYELNNDIKLITTRHFGHSAEAQNHIRDLVIAEDPDVCVPMFSWSDLLRWPVILWQTGIPMLISEHNDPVFIENHKWNRKERIACMEAADTIHILCDAFRASFPSHLHDRIFTIPNPVLPQTKLPFKNSHPGDRHRIISIGHLVDHKQHELLIDAFDILHKKFLQWDLHIWGNGPLEDHLKKRIASRNLEKKVFLCGVTDTIENEYRQSDLLCHPSRFEGFGLVVTEAMSFGLPAVGFAACSGVNEIIIDGVNGCLAPEMTAQCLAAALEKTMTDDELRQKLGANAYKTTQRYDPEKIYALWEHLISETAKYKNNTRIDRLSPDEPIIKICENARTKDLFSHGLTGPYPGEHVYFQELGALVIGYDDQWQYPTITEQQAFIKAKELLEQNPDFQNTRTVYFGFPWATLIDKILHNPERSVDLRNKLLSFKSLLGKYDRIITVCQHIRMLKTQHLFDDMGITNIFWTHAVKDQITLPEFPHIHIHPFPLYPVQAVGSAAPLDLVGEKKWLFSFVGARAADFYLTDSRNMILDHLSTHKSGCVKGRESWHFNEIVYDLQIRETISELDRTRFKQKEAAEYKHILQNSLFSLCPSGSGPNSIRLWESIGLNAIPVILADTYLPPGDHHLWDDAAVFCPETLDSIKKLPDKLEKLSRNPSLIQSMRHNMKKLWMLYGPGYFIHDIAQLFETYSVHKTDRSSYSYTPLLQTVEQISHADANDDPVHFFTVSCKTRLLTEPDRFLSRYREHPVFRNAVEKYVKQDMQEIQDGTALQYPLHHIPVVARLTSVNEVRSCYHTHSHFVRHRAHLQGYPEPDVMNANLKLAQDLVVVDFISNRLKPGARILEIGGGFSRVLSFFQEDHECWCLDKFEGIGNGPRELPEGHHYKIVQNYIGGFDSNLPSSYFDLVFSISVVEHINVPDKECQNIIDDIDRILKPDGFNLHCIDCRFPPASQPDISSRKLAGFMINHYGFPEDFIYDHYKDDDVYTMSGAAYDRFWKKACHDRPHTLDGLPFNIFLLTRKPHTCLCHPK